jgi:hypothetical protein
MSMLPRAAEIAATFEGRPPPGGEIPPLAAARRLARAHLDQWRAEDESRAPGADDAVLAGVKRKIDAMNAARSALIDEIDAWVAAHVAQRPAAPLHTETLGGLVDRLCIASVRARQLAARAAESGERERARHAERQLRELCEAYDALAVEVEAGRRRLPDWRLLKSYGRAG